MCACRVGHPAEPTCIAASALGAGREVKGLPHCELGQVLVFLLYIDCCPLWEEL